MSPRVTRSTLFAAHLLFQNITSKKHNSDRNHVRQHQRRSLHQDQLCPRRRRRPTRPCPRPRPCCRRRPRRMAPLTRGATSHRPHWRPPQQATSSPSQPWPHRGAACPQRRRRLHARWASPLCKISGRSLAPTITLKVAVLFNFFLSPPLTLSSSLSAPSSYNKPLPRV